MKRRYVLETIQWAEGEYGSLITNSQVPRRDVMRCVRAGLVESVGSVLVADTDPERYREGFKLTEAGRRAI